MAYAKNLGLAFQIVDDLIDATGAAAEAGKDVGKDAKKTTFVSFAGVAGARQLAAGAGRGEPGGPRTASAPRAQPLRDLASLRRRPEEVEQMTRCPECESDLELDGYELDVGETINCPECSVELRVVSNDPIERDGLGERRGVSGRRPQWTVPPEPKRRQGLALVL